MNNLKIMIVAESGELIDEISLATIKSRWIKDIEMLKSKDVPLTTEEAVKQLKEEVPGAIDAAVNYLKLKETEADEVDEMIEKQIAEKVNQIDDRALMLNRGVTDEL